MKILAGGNWRDGFIDYYRHPNEYRIQVLALLNLEKLNDLYFIRTKSVRLILNYLYEVGFINVIRKIRSRTQERYRNEKYVSIGFGRIVECANDTPSYSVGQVVAFVAPNHPPCLERIPLPAELIFEVKELETPAFEVRSVLYLQALNKKNVAERWWNHLRGWSQYSGNKLADKYHLTKQKVLEVLQKANWQASQHLIVETSTEIKLRSEPKISNQTLTNSRKKGVLFGYGNYAKVIAIPNISSFVSVDCIHEIDPTQIPNLSDKQVIWDSAPNPINDEIYDVYLIAGYHHTHTPLAVHALLHNASAVVEKPIVVDETQLSELVAAMEKSHGRLFSCFHKRYLPFNELAIQDMKINKGDPISYHCIVYEVPLPELHWYHWANSKSRIVSNGCHWIDHFLYLNNFCEVRSFDFFIAPDDTINCSIILENEAFFTMVLTDKGSERIGVSDYIELRANDVTVKMENGATYISEDTNKVIRKKRINKVQSYKRMYQQIGQKIINDDQGDSVISVKISAGLMLALENKLKRYFV